MKKLFTPQFLYGYLIGVIIALLLMPLLWQSDEHQPIEIEIIERLDEIELQISDRYLVMDEPTQETMEYVAKQRDDMLIEIRELEIILKKIYSEYDWIEDELELIRQELTNQSK